jgi:phage terminase Nu1 subunit (DNA packaging protein)
LQTALGIGSDNTLTKWRKRLAKWEHHEKRGRYRGRWVYLAGWVSDYRAAADAPAAAASVDEKPTARTRLEDAKARKAELELRKFEGSVVDVDEFFASRLAPCLDEVRGAAERVAKRAPEYSQVILDGINRGIEKLQANGSAGILHGTGRSGRKGRGSARAKNSAEPS